MPNPDVAANFSLIMLSSVTKFANTIPSLTRCLQTVTAARSTPAPRGTRPTIVPCQNASIDTFDPAPEPSRCHPFG
jgi:hypothetical protein